VAHLSPGLDKLLYGTYLPGIAQATAQLYSDGSVYYAGTAQAGFPATPNAYQTQNTGDYDGIIGRLDPIGSKLIFGTYFGGSNTNWIYPIAVAPDGSVWAGVSSFIACCINIQGQLIHLDASGSKLLADVPIYPDDMVVDTTGNLYTLAEGPISVSPGALLGGSCGGDAYVELSASGQQLFATYLPVQVNGFVGANAQGTPYLGTSSGAIQVVPSQSGATAPYAGLSGRFRQFWRRGLPALLELADWTGRDRLCAMARMRATPNYKVKYCACGQSTSTRPCRPLSRR
jgi:hypothetical protein